MESHFKDSIGLDEFRTIIRTSMDGFLMFDINGHILEANDSYCRLMGYSCDELLRVHILAIDAIDSDKDVAIRFDKLLQTGSLRFETKHRRKDGSIIDVEVSSNYSPLHGGSVFSFIRDISHQKRTRDIAAARLRLIDYSFNHSLDELLRETLNEAEALTGSCIGFYHFMDSDQQMLTLQAWSTRTAAHFCKAEGAGSHYNISQAGVWVDCVRERRPVIHNDYASLPHRRGMPDGHATVVRELVVPVFRGEKIVAILGIGNKPTDYNQEDLNTASLLADLAWDVADHKLIDEQLKSREMHYRTLFEDASVPIWEEDFSKIKKYFDQLRDEGISDFRNYFETHAESVIHCTDLVIINNLNKASIELFCVNSKMEMHERLSEYFIDESLAVFREELITLAEGNTRFESEIPIRMLNGDIKELILRLSVVPGYEQSLSKVLVSFMDISVQKRIEESLRESEQRYRLLVETASEGILVAQGESLKFVNPVIPELTGYAEEELLARPFLYFVHPDYRELTRNNYVKRIKGEELGQRYEIKILKKDASIRWVEISGAKIQWEGQPATLNFATDITERKRAEVEKLALVQQLNQAQKLESLGVLAGGIAHDFNNILAIIVGNCFLAKMNPDEAEKNITSIEKASERAAELCRQMLAYAGKAQFVSAQVNMTTLADEMVKMLKATIGQNVVINSNLPSDIPTIKADASQLRQIVMNLIINASEAIGEAQGEIQLKLAKKVVKTRQKEKDHLGNVIASGMYVLLEVSDTGCGMDDEIKQRIFEPFYTTKFPGRGLGMSAVLGIIMSHKGALQLSSQPGRGTTIKVYLPVQSGDFTGDESLQHVVSEPWQGSGTILLVDDEELIILTASAMLKALGFKVIEASNGKEALELFRKNPTEIALVLTDLGMPVMDGYELLRELKKLNPLLPIIISSGFGDEVVTSRIPREDIAGMVSKPYRFDQLRDVLKGIVEER